MHDKRELSGQNGGLCSSPPVARGHLLYEPAEGAIIHKISNSQGMLRASN
jgi:hypothetical protein